MFRRFCKLCKLFSESSTGCWAILQLPCCPTKQGEFLENILQNLRNKWPPHPVDTSGIETWVKAAVIELLYLGTDSGRRRNTKLTLGRPSPPLPVFLSGQKQYTSQELPNIINHLFHTALLKEMISVNHPKEIKNP